jgi:hypothetical protein
VWDSGYQVRRPLFGLLHRSRMMMSVEQSVEWVAGETEVLGEKLPQCRFVHHKSHMSRPGLEPGKPATNRLSYGTASDITTPLLQIYVSQNITLLSVTALSAVSPARCTWAKERHSLLSTSLGGGYTASTEAGFCMGLNSGFSNYLGQFSPRHCLIAGSLQCFYSAL